MYDRSAELAARPSPAEGHRTRTKLFKSLTAIVAILLFGYAAYAAFYLLPTLLKEVLLEFGPHLVRMPRE